ncbi:hypothetical protein MMC21_000197 [Puttea exsequens]|nr:hypothetical protein [Puttea exsequens]
MSTDYSKRKNAELEDLLKARSLPHNGKKADLVARLQQYDAEQAAAASSKPTSTAKTTVATEDEIDWEDDAAAAAPTDPAGAAAIAAGGQTQPSNPTAVPNQKIATDPSKTSDLTVAVAPTSGTKPAEPETPKLDYAAGLQATDLDAELAKRKARAAKFGIQESNEDALKAIERAKKFGTGSEGDTVAVKGLDQALPERGTKRGRKEEGGGRVGKRSKVRGRGRSGTPGEKKKVAGGAGGGAGGGAAYSEKDRAAADARKKRFGAA